MAKTKNRQKSLVDLLTLNYQLAELPSSQHRAGLAGLVLVIEWLNRQTDGSEFVTKVKNGAICKLLKLDAKGASFELNQLGLEALFDEIYAASTEENKETKIRTNKKGETIEPIKEEEEVEIDSQTGEAKVDKKTGIIKKKKVYFYPVTVPKGSFLADSQYDKTSDGKNGLWVKLWRDMVWSILRGVPATRKPFEARAEGTYCEDAVKVWKDLLEPLDFTVDLPSTYFLGAQAFNAETVPFKDRARFQLLLHFWLFAAQIYVPAAINNEGKRDFVGYALAIPDVADLKAFCQELFAVLSGRSTESSGYRPRDSVVDLAIESALDIAQRLRERLTFTMGEKATAYTIFGVDVIHTKKQDHNVRLLSVSRCNPDEPMLDRYAQIRESYWNPLFRRQRLLNLVNYQPWYSKFDALLCALPYEQTFSNDYFRHDVKEAFKNEEMEVMDESIPTDTKINELVLKLVSNYVSCKLNNKYQLKRSELKDNPAKKKEYEEKKEEIAKKAFLAIRGRTEQADFINYFVSTLCSVPQYLKPEEYVSLSKALYEDTDRIRTLTLLALSVNS